MSFGGSGGIPGASWYFQTLDSLGAISVASSGNEGRAVDYPASDEHVIAVGGVLPDGQRPDLSNYGQGLDLAAPFQTYALNNIDAPWYFEGASASAPFISGLAALFKSTRPYSPFAPSGPVSYVRGSATDFVSAAQMNSDGSTRPCSADIGYGVPDAYATIWPLSCGRFDLNEDAIIDVTDGQREASHYSDTIGLPTYNARYDLEPTFGPDGDVDVLDLQKVLGRQWLACPR